MRDGCGRETETVREGGGRETQTLSERLGCGGWGVPRDREWRQRD